MEANSSMSRKHHLIEYANGPSLEEINGTVEVPKGKGFLKTLFMYSGPGALVAVGYMDPGNWSTSITGGQDFSYLLMSVILMSSLIAMLLQYMAAKLGKVVIELVANIDHSDKKAILTDCKQGGGGNPTFGDGFLFRVFLNNIQPISKV